MPNDAIYMPKGTLCIGINASSSQWKHYWEGDLLRENLNIGFHTTQAATVMFAYGISKRMNILGSLPFIITKASAGNLMGQKGLQDISATVKYNFIETKSLSLNGALSLSTPSNKYVAEFLPMSIGLQSKTAVPRIIARYKLNNGLYAQSSISYVMRANVKIDRDSYSSNSKIFYTNEVALPNATEFKCAAGIFKKKLQLEGFVENFSCVSGDNIKRNDMPFLTNKMVATMLGGYVNYQIKNIALNLRTAHTISGKNTGKSISYAAGMFFNF